MEVDKLLVYRDFKCVGRFLTLVNIRYSVKLVTNRIRIFLFFRGSDPSSPFSSRPHIFLSLQLCPPVYDQQCDLMRRAGQKLTRSRAYSMRRIPAGPSASSDRRATFVSPTLSRRGVARMSVLLTQVHNLLIVVWHGRSITRTMVQMRGVPQLRYQHSTSLSNPPS